MFGIAKKGFGKALKALKKDPTTPIQIKPTPGKEKTKEYLKKLKGKK